MVRFDKLLEHSAYDKPQADTVGSIDFGILAATWSPDESLLALITGPSWTSVIGAALTGITGDNKLMLTTSTFDVLSEGPLHTDEHGEGKDRL